MIKKNIILLLCLCIITLWVSLSCGQITKVKSKGVKMNYPHANYSKLGWISETELAAFVADENGNVEGYYLESDDHFYSLDLPPYVAQLDCNSVEDTIYTHPSLLPDGRLGLVNGCKFRGNFPDERRQYLVAYDFETKQTTLLINEPLPNYLSNGFTWNGNMTRGLMQIYNGLEGTVYWLSSDGNMPVDFVVSDGERSFLPKNDFPYFSSGNEQGIIFSPAWSPDGKTIAFFVTLDAIGRGGLSRSDGEYKIFFMDPLEQKPRPVVGKIYHPSKLAWSPNSKWLAFVGSYGISRTRGIWLFSIETGKISPVASGAFENIAWSPDGNKIAATICEPNHPDLLCDRYEIWEYDVSSIYRE